MRSSERQFNALTPEESGEHVAAETNIETTEAVENPRPISETETSVSYLGVNLEKATVKGGAYVPKREQYEDFINDTEVSLPLQRDLAVAFLNGEPILVDGGTSIGKTTTVRKMASELGYEVHYANLNGATDVEDLMGRYIPNPHKRSEEDPEYIFADGKVTSGLRQEKGKVKVIILDEYNAAAPNILIRLHEVLDALERGGDVVLSEDASEEVSVNKERTKIVALMNPPGKGYIGREPIDPAQLRRWVYKKAPSELPESTFSHSTDVLFGGDNESQEVPKTDYLKSRDTALTPEELQDIPGLPEILAKYKEFHKASKELLKNRKIAEDQPQPFTYDDRMEPRRVRDFILKFYNGDINETFQQALQYYYANKLETKVDKEKLSEIIRTVEYVPKPAESKRKALNEDLEESFEKASSSEVSPTSRIEKVEKGETTIERGREIMGKDFFGFDQVSAAFGKIEMRPEYTKIPYSEAELERAKAQGEMLVLRANTGSTKLPTMEGINKIMESRLSGSEGKLLYDTDWYENEDFFKKQEVREGWALVSKDLIENSTSKDYINQTAILRDHLISLDSLTEDELSEVSNEKLNDIRKLMDRDWEAASKQLSELKINQNHRRTASEALYDFVIRFKNTTDKDRMLESVYDWTNTRASGGELVLFGGADSGGANVGRGEPDGSDSYLGVVSVR